MARQHDTSAVREAGCSIASPVRTDQRGPLGMAGRIAVVVLRHRQEGGAPGVIPRSSICLSSTWAIRVLNYFCLQMFVDPALRTLKPTI